MTRGLGLMLAAGVLAVTGIFGSIDASMAQSERQKTVAPKAAPRAPVAAPRAVPRIVAPRVVTPRVAPRIVTPQTRIAPRQDAGRNNVAPRIVTPQAPRDRTIGMRAAPSRGASRAFIHGRNYSVWRGGYRKRYGGGWRTFAALSALSAIAIGSAYYYPWAYIDAPADYCQGLTDDGCQLRWAEVPTLEGPPEFQCVAYCPWQ